MLVLPKVLSHIDQHIPSLHRWKAKGKQYMITCVTADCHVLSEQGRGVQWF